MKDIKSNTSDLGHINDVTQQNIPKDEKSLLNHLKSRFNTATDTINLTEDEGVGGFKVLSVDDIKMIAESALEENPDFSVESFVEEYGEEVAKEVVEIRAGEYGTDIRYLADNAEETFLWDTSKNWTEVQYIEEIILRKLKEQAFPRDPTEIFIESKDIEQAIRWSSKSKYLRDDFIIGCLFGDVWEFFDDYGSYSSLSVRDVDHLLDYKELASLGLTKENIDNYEEILGEDRAELFIDAINYAGGQSDRVGAEQDAIDWFNSALNDAATGIDVERDWTKPKEGYTVKIHKEFFDYLIDKSKYGMEEEMGISFPALIADSYNLGGSVISSIIIHLFVIRIQHLDEPYGGFYGNDDEVFKDSFSNRLYEVGLLGEDE